VRARAYEVEFASGSGRFLGDHVNVETGRPVGQPTRNCRISRRYWGKAGTC
jgi:hypothetical protein